MPCNESWIYCYDPETKRQSSQRKHAGSHRPKKVRLSKSTHKLLMIFFFFFDSTGMIYTGQGVQKLSERYNKCIAAGGDYFEGDLSFMCVLSIKVPIRKKSGNLFNDPRNITFPSTRLFCSFTITY